jgi:hypothetical protein
MVEWAEDNFEQKDAAVLDSAAPPLLLRSLFPALTLSPSQSEPAMASFYLR